MHRWSGHWMRSTRGPTSTSPPGDNFWPMCGGTSGDAHHAAESRMPYILWPHEPSHLLTQHDVQQIRRSVDNKVGMCSAGLLTEVLTPAYPWRTVSLRTA